MNNQQSIHTSGTGSDTGIAGAAGTTGSGGFSSGRTEEAARPGSLRFTTLLLDVDGTLLDFDAAERHGVCAVMRAHGIEPTEERVQRYHQINQGFWKAFERGDIPKEAIFQKRYPQFFSELGVSVTSSEAEARYRRELDACAILLPGALEICGYLKERYALYVVTNGVAATQYSRLGLSGLDRYFQDIFVSEDARSQKPQKEYFDYCFARIPEKDLFKMMIIGDSLTSDIRGGKNVGIATCWLNPYDHTAPPELKPDFEIQDLEELKNFL